MGSSPAGGAERLTVMWVFFFAKISGKISLLIGLLFIKMF